MYDDWFVLEFPSVISYAITLSYTPSNEYESLHAAVHTYITWCSVLTKEPHPSIPRPLRKEPERYAKEMICALRVIFKKRGGKAGLEADAGIKRQAQEIQNILQGISSLTSKSLEKHRSFVQNISLQFLLHSSDLLLASQTVEVIFLRGCQKCLEVIQTLFDEFLRAARLEQIPSPSYWKTLSVLCRRWRHQVPLVENWARKVLSLSVLIFMYFLFLFVLEEVLDFTPLVGSCAEKEEYSSLHLCWFQMLNLLGNPAEIIDFDPCGGSDVSYNFVEALLAAGRLTRTCATVFKLINVFYGRCIGFQS
ncbi:unnamed protein product [Enterobius vermicularis]|uniref:RALGAPB_N domain-containing protein n=1 Tax=Enterobius vermicularis TaxID=51028 RepID=A0A0N4V330_ENTVE|nr:unnamed protein product [Enterobius vermicularis]